jgi:hypothetical protein
MSVQRLVRIGVAGVSFVMLGSVAPAASVAAETVSVQADMKTAADKQATALISPRFGEVVRPEASELTRTQLTTPRVGGAGRVASVQDASARADDEAADMAYLEIVALAAAGLIAVLSLSRRRNL